LIRYMLSCEKAHTFEGWFSKADDFDQQKAARLLGCPVCGSTEISKMLMAPSVTTGRNKDSVHALAVDQAQKDALAKVREALTAIRANSEDVGARFPEEARKIHYGEADSRGIIGQASPGEVKSLLDEGIAIAPLPVLPEDVN